MKKLEFHRWAARMRRLQNRADSRVRDSVDFGPRFRRGKSFSARRRFVVAAFVSGARMSPMERHTYGLAPFMRKPVVLYWLKSWMGVR